jgi:hypothetical protein
MDALARSAYQLGLDVVVVRDGCLPLERDQDECLDFMQRFYGTQVIDATAAAAVLAGSAHDSTIVLVPVSTGSRPPRGSRSTAHGTCIDTPSPAASSSLVTPVTDRRCRYRHSTGVC